MRRPPAVRLPSRVWSLGGVLALYAVALPMVGFVPAATALFMVAARLFGSRRSTRDLAIGATAAVLLYLLFTAGLRLALPVDPITRWMCA